MSNSRELSKIFTADTDVVRQSELVSASAYSSALSIQTASAAALSAANSYTDSEISSIDYSSTIQTASAAALSAANSYTDSEINLIEASLIGTINTASGAVVTYLVDSAPGALDTLNELSAALNDDPNFYSTIQAVYLSQSNASATYLTQNDASATYSTITNASATYATKTELNNITNTYSFDLIQLDDLSSKFDGMENRFLAMYQSASVSISNPYRLLLTINGIIQSVDSPEYVWKSEIPRDGFMIDYEGYIAFTEVPPPGSTFDARIMPGPVTTTQNKVYPFKPLDILLGV